MGVYRPRRDWLKAHTIIGTKTQIITAARITGRDAADGPELKALLEATAKNFRISKVCGDKAYLSNEILELIEDYGAVPYIPFKVNSCPGEPGTVWYKNFHVFHTKTPEFLESYHRRSKAESTYKSVKERLGEWLFSRKEPATINELLCKIIAHNIWVVHQHQVLMGLEDEFWPKNETLSDDKLTAQAEPQEFFQSDKR